MRPDQQYFLQRKNIPLYVFSVGELDMLIKIAKEELDLRNEIESKVQAIKLAEKVEKESGNDQHVQELKDQLFLARQTYAKRVSQFDENRYAGGYIAYNDATGLPYGTEEELRGENYQPPTYDESRLQPIQSPRIEHKQEPVWQVSTVNEDGTEEHLGYTGGN